MTSEGKMAKTRNVKVRVFSDKAMATFVVDCAEFYMNAKCSILINPVWVLGNDSMSSVMGVRTKVAYKKMYEQVMYFRHIALDVHSELSQDERRYYGYYWKMAFSFLTKGVGSDGQAIGDWVLPSRRDFKNEGYPHDVA